MQSQTKTAPETFAAPGYEGVSELLIPDEQSRIVQHNFTVDFARHRGEELVLRTLNTEVEGAAPLFADRAEALHRGIGSTILEQVVEYTPNRIATRRAPGLTEASLPTRTIRKITSRQFEHLLTGYVDAAERQVVPDVSIRNTLYHRWRGFTEIDFRTMNEKEASIAPVDNGISWYLQNMNNCVRSAAVSGDVRYRNAWCRAYDKARRVLLETYPDLEGNEENGDLLQRTDQILADVRAGVRYK